MQIIELGSKVNLKGKAGNLNKLFNDFNIAKGFIIPSEVFDDYLRYNGISNLEDKEIIRSKIMDGVFREEDELINYFRKNNYKKVIVRSSASIEDGKSNSFAGQFDSILNTTVDSLVENIKKCFASKFMPCVDSYLKENKINDDFDFDILVQEMVITDLAGIAFSVNPTNGFDEILAEITEHQCHELVSGEETPHEYHINGCCKGDELVSQEILEIISNNVNNLKRIFKRDIEIEFGFKNNRFYLFQVRPITKIFYSINEYINRECWCCLKNNNWPLFVRSLWILGAVKYKNKNICNDVTEDITLYYPNNLKQIRGFNGIQKPLDDETINKHTGNDLNKYIQEHTQVSNNIKSMSKYISDYIDENNFKMFKSYFKRIIKENAVLNSYEYLISSLSSALYDKLDKRTITNVSKWKNDQDNSYFPIYGKIFKYIYRYFNIGIDFNLFRTLTHVEEIMNLCDNKLKVSTLEKRVVLRNKYGFVLLNVHNRKYFNKVIMDKRTIEVVRKKFCELQGTCEKHDLRDGIRGTSTFKNGEIITGECVVIKDNTTGVCDYDLDGKILVCEVTTAKDIDYIKGVKALIVNNGGILCHSAIFSREFNIPCLMGCKSATEYFNTHDIITYDVDSEIVYKSISKV